MRYKLLDPAELNHRIWGEIKFKYRPLRGNGIFSNIAKIGKKFLPGVTRKVLPIAKKFVSKGSDILSKKINKHIDNFTDIAKSKLKKNKLIPPSIKKSIGDIIDTSKQKAKQLEKKTRADLEKRLIQKITPKGGRLRKSKNKMTQAKKKKSIIKKRKKQFKL